MNLSKNNGNFLRYNGEEFSVLNQLKNNEGGYLGRLYYNLPKSEYENIVTFFSPEKFEKDNSEFSNEYTLFLSDFYKKNEPDLSKYILKQLGTWFVTGGYYCHEYKIKENFFGKSKILIKPLSFSDLGSRINARNLNQELRNGDYFETNTLYRLLTSN